MRFWLSYVPSRGRAIRRATVCKRGAAAITAVAAVLLSAFAAGTPAALAATSETGSSYWLASSTGQVYAFGHARVYGSAVRTRLAGQIIGIKGTGDGQGYWLIATRGRVMAFGDARHERYRAAKLSSFHGALPMLRDLRGRIVGIAVAHLPARKAKPKPKAPTKPAKKPPAPVTTTPTQTTTTQPTTTQTTTTPQGSGSTSSAPGGVSVPTNAPVYKESSSNWSGYVAQALAPFASVSGTFTVPTLAAGDAANDALAEWVGIDGASSSDQNLIQAGVGLSPGQQPYAWWEILPAAETPIQTISVNPGDTVTVNIWEVSPGEWEIQVTDDTTDQSFSTEQSYDGPGSYAEWIVEAPTAVEERHGQEQDVQTVPPAFSTDVHFSGLSASTAAQSLDDVVLIQNGSQLLTPSSLDANGFNVAYGATVPAAP